MKHFKLKKLSKKEKEYLQIIGMANVVGRSIGFPEIELELNDWFIEEKPCYFAGKINSIKINGKPIL